LNGYVHAAKAGNIGDVWKHFFLFELWKSLTGAQKPLFYLETHAGAGYYELNEKNRQQWEPGIGSILHNPASTFNRHPLVAEMTVRRSDGYRYPGSAAIAKAFVRAENMHLFEVNEAVTGMLRQHLPGVFVHREDGWEGAIRVLRTVSGTGKALIFIDPPYKDVQDRDRVSAFAGRALEVDPETLIIGWYPIVGKGGDSSLIRSLEGLGKPCFAIDCVVLPDGEDAGRLIGSGMFAVNLEDAGIVDRLKKLSAELSGEMRPR
jgi:23S rRNA (adenine2030-N6)-methyltransferase